MAKINYFVDCTTLEELKKQYKKLVRSLHPDLGGDIEEFKVMQNQYEAYLKDLTSSWNCQNPDKKQKNWHDDFFADIINKIIHFDKMDIEIIGDWIWCFNSFDYHDQLKDLGFWYSACKKAWVYNGEKKKFYRSRNTVDSLRDKWESEKIQTSKTEKLA